MHASTHSPDRRKPNARRAHSGVRALALLALLAAVPAPAAADIYKWIDEQGGTVISDVPPMEPARVSGLKLLAAGRRTAQARSGPEEDEAEAAAVPDARESDASPRAREAVTSRRQQELEAKIEELERRLQAQQSAPQQTPAPADGAGAYYPAPPAPAAEAVQYGGPVAIYSQSYYSSYYLPQPVPAYTVVISRPRRFPHASAPPRRPASAPQRQLPLVGRTPGFVGPTPQFVGRTPQFVPQSPQPLQRRPQFMNAQPRFANPVPHLHHPPTAVPRQRARR